MDVHRIVYREGFDCEPFPSAVLLAFTAWFLCFLCSREAYTTAEPGRPKAGKL